MAERAARAAPKAVTGADILNLEAPVVDFFNDGNCFQLQSRKVSLLVRQIRQMLRFHHAEALFEYDSYEAYAKSCADYEVLRNRILDQVFLEWQNARVAGFNLDSVEDLPPESLVWHFTAEVFPHLPDHEVAQLATVCYDTEVRDGERNLNITYPRELAFDSRINAPASMFTLTHADWHTYQNTYATFLYTYFNHESMNKPALAAWPAATKVYNMHYLPNKARAVMLIAFYFYETVSSNDVAYLKQHFNAVVYNPNWYVHVFVKCIQSFRHLSYQLNQLEINLQFDEPTLCRKVYDEVYKHFANSTSNNRYDRGLVEWCVIYETRTSPRAQPGADRFCHPSNSSHVLEFSLDLYNSVSNDAEDKRRLDPSVSWIPYVEGLSTHQKPKVLLTQLLDTTESEPDHAAHVFASLTAAASGPSKPQFNARRPRNTKDASQPFSRNDLSYYRSGDSYVTKPRGPGQSNDRPVYARSFDRSSRSDMKFLDRTRHNMHACKDQCRELSQHTLQNATTVQLQENINKLVETLLHSAAIISTTSSDDNTEVFRINDQLQYAEGIMLDVHTHLLSTETSLNYGPAQPTASERTSKSAGSDGPTNTTSVPTESVNFSEAQLSPEQLNQLSSRVTAAMCRHSTAQAAAQSNSPSPTQATNTGLSPFDIEISLG